MSTSSTQSESRLFHSTPAEDSSRSRSSPMELLYSDFFPFFPLGRPKGTDVHSPNETIFTRCESSERILRVPNEMPHLKAPQPTIIWWTNLMPMWKWANEQWLGGCFFSFTQQTHNCWFGWTVQLSYNPACICFIAVWYSVQYSSTEPFIFTHLLGANALCTWKGCCLFRGAGVPELFKWMQIWNCPLMTVKAE